MMERIRREGDSRGLVSDSRTRPTRDSGHDFIRTPFGAFKYFMKSLSSLLFKRIQKYDDIYPELDPVAISSQKVLLSSVLCHLFWPIGLCTQLSLVRARPRVSGQPRAPVVTLFPFLYPQPPPRRTRVLFRSSLAFATCL